LFFCTPIQAKGQVRPQKSAYHSIALPAKISKKDISLLLPRARPTMDKIVDRCAITIYPYSFGWSQYNSQNVGQPRNNFVANYPLLAHGFHLVNGWL